jgi:hypothetical protein
MQYPIIEAGETFRSTRAITTEYVTDATGEEGRMVVALDTRHDKARRTYVTWLRAVERVERAGYHYDMHTMYESPSVLLDRTDAGARFAQSRLEAAHAHAAAHMLEWLAGAGEGGHAATLRGWLTAASGQPVG